jgi:hypothetical protein
MAGTKPGHDEGRKLAFPRRVAPELLIDPSPDEGVGNAGWPAHPQPRVEKITHAFVTTVAPDSPGIPARGWF